ncbi:MAG: hypothetical protein M3347_01400 [Armatimonadota bacterium]|nr:hypothetical protein [Armatimonadota bacterium]
MSKTAVPFKFLHNCYLVLALAATGFAGDWTVVPGRSVGKVRLGMTRTTVHQKLGKPGKTARWRSGLVQDSWLASPVKEFDERTFVHVLYKKNKAIQIEFNSPRFVTTTGISMRSSLAQFRAKHKKPRVRAYVYADPDGSGYVGYYYDDVKRGLTFELGTQDYFDARATPHSLRVHLPGRPVLPDPGGKPTPARDEIAVSSKPPL